MVTALDIALDQVVVIAALLCVREMVMSAVEKQSTSPKERLTAAMDLLLIQV